LQTVQTFTSSLINSPIQNKGKNTTINTAKMTHPVVDIRRSMRGGNWLMQFGQVKNDGAI
jgi:hypothetical protein